jgi:O-antigen/teichoic acid export membrane protein
MLQTTGGRTVKNAAYGFVSYLWPILFSFFLTPFIIHKLGVAQYGVYVLLLTVVGFFSLFNFGFIYTFVRELSAADTANEAEQERLRKIFGATLTVFIFVGILALLVGAILMFVGPALFKVAAVDIASARIGFLFIGLLGFVNSVSVVYGQIPYALQRQDIGTNITIANITVFNVLSLIAVYMGFGVATLVFLQFFSALCTLVILYVYSRRLAPWFTPRFHREWKVYSSLGTAGGYVYLHNLSSTFLGQLDRMIISTMIGSSVLTYYSIPNSITEKIQGTITSLSGILFPLTSQLHGQGEALKLQRIYRRAMTIIVVLATALSATVAVFGAKLLTYWVGPEIAAISVPLLGWLVPTYFLLAIFMPLTNFLGGIGKTKFMAMSSLLMAIFNVILLVALLPKYGILGAAMAYFFSLLPLIGIIYYMERYYFLLTDSGVFYLRLAGKLVVACVVFALITLPVNAFLLHNLLGMVIAGPIAIVAFIALYWAFGFFCSRGLVTHA